MITETQGTQVKRYTYNIGDLATAFTVTASGSSVMSSSYGYDALGRMTQMSGTGGASASAAYTYDANSNPLTITYGNGVQQAYEYDAFGNLLNAASGDTNPFRYSGEYFDSETGNYYLRARYYDPSAGRFISEDSVKDGINWYVYCRNNPVLYIDPTGYITEEEQKMFENGELAPMAYSYLMNLTYQWYLADDEASKAIYHQWAEDFRATGYTTTNGMFPYIHAGIKYMSSAPTDSITKEQHFFRNELNLQFSWNTFKTLNERLPDNLKWKELPFEQSLFHKFGQVYNRKYVSACEHFEAVYTKENYLVNENFSAMNMGTYNYYGPTQAKKHADIDVAPWGKWGNTPKGWIWSDWFD